MAASSRARRRCSSTSIMLLAMLRAVYAARRLDAARAVVGRALDADGRRRCSACAMAIAALSSWQGGGPVAAERDRRGRSTATGVRTRPLRQARDWGYQRLAAGATRADRRCRAAADRAAGRGRLRLDAGVRTVRRADAAGRQLRRRARCAGATLPADAAPRGCAPPRRIRRWSLGDSNSTAIHADGTLGRGVGEVELARQESDAGQPDRGEP